MRVGLDAIPLAAPRTGVGHYTFELARHLAFADPDSSFDLISPFPFDPSVFNHELPANLQTHQIKTNPLRRRWFAVGLPLHLRKSDFDLFHGTNYEVPLWNNRPRILTIHDLSILLYPETHEGRLVRRGRRRLPIMARMADRIITPTKAIKREVVQYLAINEAKVVVIPEAPRSSFSPMPRTEALATLEKLGIEQDFIFFAGTIEPRKNLVTLLSAFQEILRSTAHRPQLVISGKTGWLMDEFWKQLKAAGLEDRLRFTGYLVDEELRALYSTCRVFVFPSLYEGFGLPPLEAMACGAPVITSRTPALVETTGDAARHVAPLDVNDLAKNIVELLENESQRKYLSSAGLKHSARFSWDRTATATLEVYREAIVKRGERSRLTRAR